MHIFTFLGYKFEKRTIINGEMKLSFFLMERNGKAKKVVAPYIIELEPFILNIMDKEYRISNTMMAIYGLTSITIFIFSIFLFNSKNKS